MNIWPQGIICCKNFRVLADVASGRDSDDSENLRATQHKLSPWKNILLDRKHRIVRFQQPWRDIELAQLPHAKNPMLGRLRHSLVALGQLERPFDRSRGFSLSASNLLLLGQPESAFFLVHKCRSDMGRQAILECYQASMMVDMGY